MKIFLCFLFSFYASLNALSITAHLFMTEVILISLHLCLCCLLGFSTGKLLLRSFSMYTSFELTSIVLMFLLLYHIQVKQPKKTDSFDSFQTAMNLGIIHLGMGILCSFAEIPLWMMFSFTFVLNLFSPQKTKLFFPEFMKSKFFKRLLIVIMLILLFQ